MIRAAAALLAMALTAAPVQAETLRIGTEPDYAPYMFLDAKGQFTGFDKDLGDIICAQGAFDCEWVPMAFSDLIPAIQTGRIDIAISGMASTQARARIVDFTIDYRPPGPAAGAFAALRPGLSADGLLAGVQIGTIQADYLASAGHPHRTYPDSRSMIDALRRGEVEVIFGGYGNIDQIIRDTDPDLRIIELVEVPGYGTAIAVSRARKGLLPRLDSILTGLFADGTLDRLEQVWFPDGQDL
jgi:polar amino acid transport system substrate-binding protein